MKNFSNAQVLSISDKKTVVEIVNSHTVEWAINSFLPYKAPGEDGIFPIMLQKSYPQIRHILISIYRASITLAYLPRSFRVARIAFLPKPGKISYDTAKAFRSISLSSFVLKALEKVIDCYLFNGSVRRNMFSPNQH